MNTTDRNSSNRRTARTAGQVLAAGAAVELLDTLGLSLPPTISIIVMAIIAAVLVRVMDWIGGPLGITWPSPDSDVEG